MSDLSAIAALTDILRDGAAQVVVAPERFGPASIYDLTYRLALQACTFQIHAEQAGFGSRRIVAAKFKLLQFVAARPWLLGAVRQWSSSRRERQLSFAPTERLRRGFLGDSAHDDVLAFVLARGILARSARGTHLEAGENIQSFISLYDQIVAASLFQSERDTLQEMLGVRITSQMLEGW